MKKILKILSEISVEDLAQTALTLSQLCKDPHLASEQKKNNYYHKIMSSLPIKINKLIQAVDDQEIVVIDHVKKQLISQGKSLFNLGIDDVMTSLFHLMPEDLALLDYSVSAKASVLGEIIKKYFGQIDVINEKILLPLDKISNTIQAKRHELTGLKRINETIDAEAENTIEQLKTKYGYWQTDDNRQCLCDAIGMISDRIEQLEQTKADPVEMTELKDEKNRLLERRKEVTSEIIEIENKIQIDKIYLSAATIKKQNEKEEADKELREQMNLFHEIDSKKNELASELIKKILPCCSSYKDYLEKILITKLESANIEVAKIAMMCSPLFKKDGVKPGPRGIEYLAPSFGKNDRQQIIEGTLPHTVFYDMGVDKYKSICGLIETIKPNVIYFNYKQKQPTAFEQLNQFYDFFFLIRDNLEKPRDNFALKLAKFICSAISFGQGIPGINKKPEGGKLVTTIETISFWKAKPNNTEIKSPEVAKTPSPQAGRLC